VKFEKLIFFFLILPTFIGCTREGLDHTIENFKKPNLAEVKECYEAVKAKADSTKLRTEYSAGNINKLNYELASEVATKWVNIACKNI
jgi:hypothetical protein